MKHILSFGIMVVCAIAVISACKQDTTVSTTTTPTITTLNCSGAMTTNAVAGAAYNASAMVPYSGGNAVSYAAGSAIASTGVTGLTATLQAGTLAASGNLVYTITGTPSGAGTATFPISFGGQSCSFSITVSTSGGGMTAMCSSSSPAKVLAAVNAFKASLSASQITSVQLAYTSANAYKWSNLPASLSARNGLRLADLTAAQRTLALVIVQAATGTVPNEGYDEVAQIIAADDVLGTVQPNGYGNYQYYIAFYGTPAATGTWQLQFTGHHITHNITYKDGAVAGGSPIFSAVEPDGAFTSNGASYDPIGQEKTALRAMLASLSATELATAKSPSTFGDIILGPGKDKQFPTTRIGLAVSTLSAAQQALVLAAIRPWVQDLDPETATCLLNTYQNELAGTFITYSGNIGLTAQNDYVRIDGPSVWIEFHYAGGVIYRNQPHVHSIYRDRTRDYGGSF